MLSSRVRVGNVRNYLLQSRGPHWPTPMQCAQVSIVRRLERRFQRLGK